MRERIASLDVLRGVAILGTFATNVWLFAHPGGPLGFLAQAMDVSGAEAALRAVSNGKFLALLTLLFGVGMELQYRSALRRGTPWPGRYVVRAGVLFVEGLLHYLLVFEFDVLMGYAVTSLLVAYLIGRSDRVVRRWAVGVGAVYVAVLGLGTAALLALPDVAAAPVGPEATASWTAQVATRVVAFPLLRAEIVLIVPSAVVLFLVGSRLLRAGAFADTPRGDRLRRWLVAAGLGAGVPLTVLTTLGGGDWFLVDRYLVPPLVALGLLGLVTQLTLRARGGTAGRALGAVGRTALSCYVLQNVVASVLCYGWGFGLAARFGGDPLFVVALWAGVSALCAACSVLWLRRAERGPLELVLHRLTDRREPKPAGQGRTGTR